MSLDNKIYIIIIIICDYNTSIRQIKFIQGNMISSEYTINEYARNVPRQKIKNNPRVIVLLFPLVHNFNTLKTNKIV